MKISRKQLLSALSILEEHDTKNKAGAVRMALKKICKDMARDDRDDTADLIDRSAYFATIMWQEEDIKDALREHGIKPTRDKIDKVICRLDTDEMESCEHGWDVINDTISRVLPFHGFIYD